MPFKSEAQRGYMHAAEDRGEIKPSVVSEFDKSSKGLKLPTHVKQMSGGGYACMHCGGDVDDDGFTMSTLPGDEEEPFGIEPTDEQKSHAYIIAIGRGK